MKTVRIVIADDHRLMREGVRRILGEVPDFEVVFEAEDGAEAVRQCAVLTPDLVLLDLDMPNINGIQAARALLKQRPAVKVVILTMHRDPKLIEQLAELGVNGYLYKSSHPEDLVYGIRKVMRGEAFFETEVAQSLLQPKPAFARSLDATAEKLVAGLSSRESEILKHLAQGATHAEIAEALHISPRTVDSHKQNLLRKLEVKNVAGLVRIAVKSGLV